MISYAYRYAPIWQSLSTAQLAAGVLEVGSGAEGLALFWKGPLVSVDLHFKRGPLAPGVQGSALNLPFAARSFRVVVSCDMLEHIPAPQRQQAVSELVRVSGGEVLLGFPSGETALQLYEEIGSAFGDHQPVWLREHMDLGLPDAAEVTGWLCEAGWQVEVSWYESARVHKRLVSWERSTIARWSSYIVSRCLGPTLIARVAARLQVPQDPMRVLLRAKPPV